MSGMTQGHVSVVLQCYWKDPKGFSLQKKRELETGTIFQVFRGQIEGEKIRLKIKN